MRRVRREVDVTKNAAQPVGASQIVALIRATKEGSYIATLEEAALLVEGYGLVAASAASIDATEKAYERIDAILSRVEAGKKPEERNHG